MASARRPSVTTSLFRAPIRVHEAPFERAADDADDSIHQGDRQMGTLKGAVAVVTGGARGIGRAIAEELGRYEATVVVNYAHSQEAADEVVAWLHAHGSPQAIAIQADVADKAQAQQLIDETIKRFGRLDVLVNNAGITRDRTLKKMAAEDWDQVIQTDLSSDFYTLKAALPCLMQQNFGRIVNLSSYNGEVGSFGQANYSAAKAGIIGFTKTAALELAHNNVTVNAVAPGFTDTDMFADVPAEVKQQIVDRIPLGRLATPEEIAKVVRFLVVDGDYITGAVIDVNGGLPC
jgi:NAD(P)-dependent dehydrogenase (short-subunit alcohol dehydrogenase family)